MHLHTALGYCLPYEVPIVEFYQYTNANAAIWSAELEQSG